MFVEFDTFADGEDIGVRGAHLCIDLDRPAHLQAGVMTDLHSRPDARRHDDDVCRKLGAVVKQYFLDLAVADDLFGIRFGDDLDAALFQVRFQQVTGGLIQLSIHQMAHDVQDGHFHPTHAQAGCSLKAQQAATNDNGGGFPIWKRRRSLRRYLPDHGSRRHREGRGRALE